MSEENKTMIRHFYRIVNSKIAKVWANLDLLGVLRQPGALPMRDEGDGQGS